MSTVTTLIPVYNGAEYIRDAVDSVLAQRRVEVEVIVIDDGSTDETPEMLAEYGNRIKVLRQQNAGHVVARNNGANKRWWTIFPTGGTVSETGAVPPTASRYTEPTVAPADAGRSSPPCETPSLRPRTGSFYRNRSTRARQKLTLTQTDAGRSSPPCETPSLRPRTGIPSPKPLPQCRRRLTITMPTVGAETPAAQGLARPTRSLRAPAQSAPGYRPYRH